MDMPLSFRWLGAQGVELSCDGQVLLIDPFFTRPPASKVLFQKLYPDGDLAASHLRHCDHILVTHTHYDHVMDVPGLALRRQSLVYGSANTGRIMEAYGVPQAQFQEIQPDCHLSLGPFEVDVIASQHIRFPLDRLLAGPLKEGLRPPLRLMDYRLDHIYGFFIRVQGLRILFCPGPARPADLIFAGVAYNGDYYRRMLSLAAPSLFIPLHWDNFFRPLDQPLRELAWPGRMSLRQLERLVMRSSPAVRFLVPGLLKPVALGDSLPG